MAKKKHIILEPVGGEGENPKEGRSLGSGPNPFPDMSAGNEYPMDFPKGADAEVSRSVWGKNENEKTYYQDHLDKKGD